MLRYSWGMDFTRFSGGEVTRTYSTSVARTCSHRLGRALLSLTAAFSL
jgi:hypothetical protein